MRISQVTFVDPAFFGESTVHWLQSNIRLWGVWTVCGLCALSTSASSQTVTLSELEGREIEFSSVYEQQLVRNGRTLSSELHTVGRVVIGPKGTITTRFQNTAVFP